MKPNKQQHITTTLRALGCSKLRITCCLHSTASSKAVHTDNGSSPLQWKIGICRSTVKGATGSIRTLVTKPSHFSRFKL